MPDSFTWVDGPSGNTPVDAANLNREALIADIGTAGTRTGDALRAAYVPKWKPSTAYAAGEPVLNPSGQTVTANSAFTSGATYSAANWTVVSGGAGGTVSDATTTTKGIVQLAGDLAGTAAAPTVGKIGGVPILLSDTRPGSPATGLVRIGLAATGNTVPGAPTIGTATAGNATATVAFTAPASNGGATITGYTATSTPGGLTGTGTTSPITVSGLTNSTAYTFTVHATNSVGNSAESAASNSITPTTGTTVPGAPTGLTAAAGNAQAALSWTAPASNGGAAISDYTVQYRTTAGPGAWTTFTHTAQTATTITVTGLTNATGYDFQVAAVNSAGTGSYSSTASATPTGSVGTNPTSVAGLSSLWTVDALSSTSGTEIDSFPSSAGSGTNNTMIQGAGTGPIYQAGVQNGLPVLRGDGTRTMFTSGSLSPVVGTTFTMFIVARFSTFSSGSTMTDGTTTNSLRLYADSGTTIQMFTGGAGTPSYTLPSNTSWHVFAVRRTGTGTNGLSLWVDGTSVAQATATGTTTINQMRIFGDGTTPAHADLGEMVAYNATALSDADMLGVTRFLGSKWGVTTA